MNYHRVTAVLVHLHNRWRRGDNYPVNVAKPEIGGGP